MCFHHTKERFQTQPLPERITHNSQHCDINHRVYVVSHKSKEIISLVTVCVYLFPDEVRMNSTSDLIRFDPLSL